MYRLLLLFIYLSITLFANEKVVLQLKWLHQFQFAGYYAAKEKGFYKDLGLDVEIRQRDLRFNNIQQVIDGEAQYGIADSVLVLYKAKNEPVVIVSPIFQHSPSVLVSLKSTGLSSVYDFDNKQMLFYSNDTDGFSILAMLNKLGVKPNLIRKRSKNDYLKLLNKEVDVFPAYLSNEPFYFKQLNEEINIINPANYGFDLYGDMLFTSQKEATEHPDRVRKFKEATLKGWNYALENQEEIIQLIHKKYNKTKSLEHLRYEAKAIERVISKDTIPLGTADRGRLRYISELHKEYGLYNTTIDVKEFIFDDYKSDSFLNNLTIEEQRYLKENPVLMVQNLSTFPPFNFNENDKALGYTVDYMKLIAKFLDVDIEFISGKSWAQNLEMLKTNELDVIPHIAINEERKKFIDFTSFKHLDYIPAIATTNASDVKSLEDLKEKKVAVLNKSFINTILEKNFPSIKLHLVNKIDEGLKVVSSGEVDAYVDNLATMQFYIQKGWLNNIRTVKIENSKVLKNTPLHMGVSKGNEKLKSILEKVNDYIPQTEKIKLRQEWVGKSSFNPNEINFTSKELTYLNDKKKIRMCIDPNWMPFEKLENNVHIGITSDYMKIFKGQLPVPIELIKTKNWLETVEYAKSRKCDFITSMSETEDRKKDFNFTKSLMQVPIVIATTSDKQFVNTIADVKDKKLAIVKGFGYINQLKEQYPNINLVEVNGAKQGLQMVSDGEIYGFIGVMQAVGYNIQEHFFNNLKIVGKLNDSWSFPMATRVDEPLLNAIFNKLISNISDETHSSISNKWVAINFQESIDYSKLAWISAIFLVIITIIIYKNKSINEINEKMQKYINVVDENVLTSSTDKHGIIINASQAFCDISGYTKEELLGQNHSIIRHPDMKDELYVDLWRTITSGKIWKGEIKNRKKDGSYYWVLATISPNLDESGRITGYTSIRQDITLRKKIQELSITDELTTLYNKRYFNEVFEKEINRAKRDERYFGFIIFDIDHFKQYNDNYGHQKGDDVLEKVGKTIKQYCKRSSDIPFRIGGEEFGIIFSPHFEEIALEFATNLRKEIENLKIEHKFNSASSYITVSVGLYVQRGLKIDSSKDIYRFADSALYEAKEKGRNQVIKV